MLILCWDEKIRNSINFPCFCHFYVLDAFISLLKFVKMGIISLEQLDKGFWMWYVYDLSRQTEVQ